MGLGAFKVDFEGLNGRNAKNLSEGCNGCFARHAVAFMITLCLACQRDGLDVRGNESVLVSAQIHRTEVIKT